MKNHTIEYNIWVNGALREHNLEPDEFENWWQIARRPLMWDKTIHHILLQAVTAGNEEYVSHTEYFRVGDEWWYFAAGLKGHNPYLGIYPG
jgi:hypothetical protein